MIYVHLCIRHTVCPRYLSTWAALREIIKGNPNVLPLGAFSIDTNRLKMESEKKLTRASMRNQTSYYIYFLTTLFTLCTLAYTFLRVGVSYFTKKKKRHSFLFTRYLLCAPKTNKFARFFLSSFILVTLMASVAMQIVHLRFLPLVRWN